MFNRNTTRKTRTKKAPSYTNEFNTLLRKMRRLARHKLGYPVSLLTYLGIVDNQILGINPGTLADILLNNVGDPFIDSQTSLMEVKKHERKLIRILEKYYGLSKNEARGYVTTGGTEGNFASLWWSKRYLISCALPALIKRDDEIKQYQKKEKELLAILSKTPNNAYQERSTILKKIVDIKNTILENQNIVQQLLAPTVFFAKDATHYSIPKIAEILHLHIRTVSTNLDGSIQLDNFKKELILHLSAHPHSSIIVVANIGTTITGAIDNVPQLKKIIDHINPKPRFTIHLDGALTGFVMPILKPFGDIPNYFDALGVNTLVFSAHKYPGLSQPCGIILAKRQFFEKAFEKSERSVEYVGNIRDVTITGSRSGLNVLMFYNALYTLELSQSTEKLKKMLDDNIENAKYLYNELTKIYGSENIFYPQHFNITFPKPSMAIAKKYQLMLTGDRATICVLANVTKELINKFIQDLKIDKEKTMKDINSKPSVRLENLTEKYEKSAISLFVKSFCDSEPMTEHLKITYQDYTPFATAVVNKAVKDGLSQVALNEKDEVIGLFIAEDLSDPFTPNLEKYPKFKPIHAFLDALSKPFMENKKFKKGKVMHTWIAAIDPKYRSQGLYKEMGLLHVTSAMKKGFDFIYSDFTNELSEKIVSQFDVIRLSNTMHYNDFKYQSQTPFQGLTGGASAYITPLRPDVTWETLTNCYTLTEKMR